MKIRLLILLLAFSTICNAQFSLFKDINTVEDGSTPNNFTECNGFTFFSVKASNGYNLWKTDGTEAGTVEVSNQSIILDSNPIAFPNFQVNGNFLYYTAVAIGSNNFYELWKTDGQTNSFVSSQHFGNNYYFLNNSIFAFRYPGLTKINENDNTISTVWIPPTGYYFSSEIPIKLNGELYFQLNKQSGDYEIQIWKTNGTAEGTVLIKSITDSYYHYFYYSNYNKKFVKVGNEIFFMNFRFESSSGPNKYITDLWKTDGTELGTIFIKNLRILNFDNFNNEFMNLVDCNGKLVFNDNTDLWISDGTANGTKPLKTFNYLGYTSIDKFYHAYDGKFYFTANMANDNELWQSDGTETGTILLKNINLTSSSNPSFFELVNNKLYFQANQNELWKTDGSEAGTVFIRNIANINDGVLSIKYKGIYSPTTKYLFSNYDPVNDYELWKVDEPDQTPTLLKNINTDNKSSVVSSTKAKVGNEWFFTAANEFGAELWKSDGTASGTMLVKDINPGLKGITINAMAAVDNSLYFTMQYVGISGVHLFKSDGSEAGTFEILIDTGVSNGIPDITTIKKFGNKVCFFTILPNYQRKLWVSDGTANGTYPISYSFDSFSDLIIIENKIFFKGNGHIFTSDGFLESTKVVYSVNMPKRPQSPICLVSFKNKLYFFSNFMTYESGSYEFKQGFYESDGTEAGTKVIKDFDPNTYKLTDNTFLFLEKSETHLFFRANYNLNTSPKTFDLWRSDGTSEGTYFLKKVEANSEYRFNYDFIGSNFFMFHRAFSSPGRSSILVSDGTLQGTKIIFDKISKSPSFISSGSFKGKLLFGAFTNETGYELWATDYEFKTTNLVGEITNGSKSSFSNGFMDFPDKLLFWANDGSNIGNELWQLNPYECFGNQNVAINSGLWNDVNIWSCGHIPTDNEVVIMKDGVTILVPTNYWAKAKQFVLDGNGIIELQSDGQLEIKN
jgi:ELWxxDGT repeat protein